MINLKKSDIGKRVICGIYISGGKTYGEIVSFTDTKIMVKTDPYNKLVEYYFDDVDMDFQPGDGFETDMKEQLDRFNGVVRTKEVVEEVVVVPEVEVEVVVGVEPKQASTCQTIQVKDGI